MSRSMVFSWSKHPSMLMKKERSMRIEKSSARKKGTRNRGKLESIFYVKQENEENCWRKGYILCEKMLVFLIDGRVFF